LSLAILRIQESGVTKKHGAWGIGKIADFRLEIADLKLRIVNVRCEMWAGIEHRVWSIESDTLYLNSWLLAPDY
jgi:hypothetical protein